MDELPVPPIEALVYSDDQLYVCLASYPITRGHTIVVWKDKMIKDLSFLSCGQYNHLLDVIDAVRDALLASLGLEKVYLLYMDEVRQVHWHLVPRYNEQGVNVLTHKPELTTDFSFAPQLKEELAQVLLNHPELA